MDDNRQEVPRPGGVKFLHLTYHFEFAEAIEAVLERHEIQNFVRYSMVEGKDRDGKHFGTKVFPGSSAVVQAQVPQDKLGPLLEQLKRFKEAEASHRHVRALVLPVEDML